MIIDATNLKVGRIATVASKAALTGEKVDIINCEKAVLTGSKEYLLSKYQARHDRGGPEWGPFQPRMPDRFVRRIIRGMLPYKTPRGRDAFRRVMCYIGNPQGLEGAQSIKAADITLTETVKFLTVGELCGLLGGRT
jgi:large subunit ribosomal protein L13